MSRTDTPVAPTIDNASQQIQSEIDKAAQDVVDAEALIVNHMQGLPDSYDQLARDLAAKRANPDQLVKAHAKYVMEHPAILKALQDDLNAKKVKKQALENQKAKLLVQLNEPDV